MHLRECVLTVCAHAYCVGENLPSFMWDAEPQVRDAAVRFVYEDTFAEDAGE